MKITIFSDLHLEFGLLDGDDPSGDVLILAGDVTTKANPHHIGWINRLDFNHVIYVLGNHEFYGSDYDEVINKTRERIGDHVHLLENESITIDGIKFVGATLWTDCDKGNPITMNEARLYLNDYNCIRIDRGKRRFIPEDAYYKFQKSFNFLQKEVDENTVVVTHHAPSFRSIHENYKESNLNGLFASNLDDFIEKRKPKLWIHGHVHNCFDYNIGETRVICNPRGYKFREENKSFTKDLTVEI